MIVARIALLLVVGACAAPSAKQHAPSRPGEPDAIVVLGNRPARDAQGIAYETRARVEHGVALYRAGRAPRIVFTGGKTTDDVEADVMAAHAEQAGVPSAAVLRERASIDTIENAHLSVAMLRASIGDERRPRVLLVTSDYHSERAAMLFRCAGADVTEAPVTLSLTEAERAARRRHERMAQLYYLLIDECKRASG